MPKIDPRNAPCAVVHSAADKVLGKRTARAQLGNTNYYLTLFQGVVVHSSMERRGVQNRRSESSMPISPFSIRKVLRLSWRTLTSSGCIAYTGLFWVERTQLICPSWTPFTSLTILWWAEWPTTTSMLAPWPLLTLLLECLKATWLLLLPPLLASLYCCTRPLGQPQGDTRD